MTIEESFDFDGVIDYGFDEDVEIKSTKATRVSLKTFLTVYVGVSKKGGNSIDVARELGISPQAVRQRVGKMILKGIKLPKLGNICRKQQSIN